MSGAAERKVLLLNHVAIHVADVARSVDFYSRVLMLKPLPRPAFSFPGAWFALGPGQELHLIGDEQYPSQTPHRGNHFALLIEDAPGWLAHLHACGLIHTRIKTRPDGALQIFLADPDGHFIELCTVPAACRS
jgi:catechol 2,3-dioxygenase-like lactoylglutathione lyase family enzyme